MWVSCNTAMADTSYYVGDADGSTSFTVDGVSPGSEGSGGGAPGQGSSSPAATAATFSVTKIISSCGDLDPAPCSTEMALFCPDAPPDGLADQWRVAVTQVFAIADTEQANPLSSTTGCVNFAAQPGEDPGPSQADVRELMTTLIPTSGAGTSPQPDASGMAHFLLNLPLIVYATGKEQITAGPVPLVGHDVEVAAEAVSYQWAVGDVELVTDEPGRAYDGSPCTLADCSAYLHIGPIRVPGQHPLLLTTSWTGRYRVDGGPWIEIAEPIEKVSAPVVINVREARGVLVHD
jgi:hypothetical protein